MTSSKTRSEKCLWISLFCRLALIAPVIAAVSTGPGAPAGEAEGATGEGLALLPGESISSRVRREYTNNRAARRRVFKQTDLNGDGLVTRKEYVMRNGNMTEEELDILFGAFDVDGDRSLSQDEFVRHGLLWVVAQECELDSIQRCDAEFVYLIRATDPAIGDDQQATLCRALQTYFDCIEHEQVSCDISSYSQAVVDLMATYRSINFCPDLNFAGLLSMPNTDDELDVDVTDGVDDDVAFDNSLDPSDLSSYQDSNDDVVVRYRTKRRAHPASQPQGFRFPWWDWGGGGSSTNHGTTSCTTSALSTCTEQFNDELRRITDVDFCQSMSDFRHCLTRQARSCTELELLEAEESMRKWLHLHQKLELC